MKAEIYAVFQQTAEDVFFWQMFQERFVELCKTKFSPAILSPRRIYSDPGYQSVLDGELRIIPDSLSIRFEFQAELQHRFREGLQKLLEQAKP